MSVRDAWRKAVEEQAAEIKATKLAKLQAAEIGKAVAKAIAEKQTRKSSRQTSPDEDECITLLATMKPAKIDLYMLAKRKLPKRASGERWTKGTAQKVKNAYERWLKRQKDFDTN